MSSTTNWNPEIPGQDIRLKANPGKRGKTTGRIRRLGKLTLVEIEFGPAEKIYRPKNLLELCGDDESIEGLIRQGRFGGPDDLRRILTFEKVKGRLTNVFYSMEASQTDFYPHQFKPVLKFLNSPVGRLLIADEVGLGKTIEAMYIWKELQTREEARRLLIVCPAMLRQKWQDDLRQRFNIFADIVDANELLRRVRLCLEHQQPQSFVCIASLEGLRPIRNWEDINVTNARAELARLLDANPSSEALSLFDLAIIDEAHYLRNPAAAGNQLGQLIRDAAKHLILLTATPIQTDSANLYQILRIISPDDFFNADIFNNMLEANEPVVQALRYLWASPPEPAKARKALQRISTSGYFADNPLLEQIQQNLSNLAQTDESKRIELGYKLEKVSLLGQYITRSRKRDVLRNRVKRKPQTLEVHFSSLEQDVYNRVSEYIREQGKGRKGAPLFQLISRQRQMTSCMVAALEAWQNDASLSTLVDEALWEDFGQISEQSNPHSSSITTPSALKKVNIQDLEDCDSKYSELQGFLQKQLKKNPNEKFVIFAYFRGTLRYLQRRLEATNISNCLIMGDMGDDKWATVERFRQDDGPSVLLSSEVGSEGIDLQHCHFLVNYDLPWNPMRVEQRIGRLDRLGQSAESISIINFSLVDTIEERILERLYDRIQVFKESIGDIESILGQATEKLLVDLFSADLTPKEREERAMQTENAIINERLLQNELENEAVNMLAFSDHILDSINQSLDQGRWLQPDELLAFVEDCFSRYYPGTVIEPKPNEPKLYNITLSEQAKIDLQFFIGKNRCATPTQLHNRPMNCFFDPKISDSMGKRNELLDPTHPLILWIRERYTTSEQTLHPVSAIKTQVDETDLSSGLYAYSVHRWTFSGIKTESQIAYKIIRIDDGHVLSDQDSEAILSTLMKQGQTKPNAQNFIEDIDGVLVCLLTCDEHIDTAFNQALEDFYIDNENRCNIQEKSARAFAERKQRELESRLDRFRQAGKTQIIPATEGQLKKVKRELEVKLKNIQEKRDDLTCEPKPLAAGVIFVEEKIG
ncbi:DNA/RNA helicase, superfamily II, SNF2 family [Leptolyngbya sp. PCC 7375]|nr:DNA/RNA helicase, superfamily II, SNF2 family [Leptolyngbya sp. PCC 7375]